MSAAPDTHALLLRFYEALQRRDAAAVGACYHEQAIFTRPVLGRALRASPSAKWPSAPATGSWTLGVGGACV